MSKRRGGSLPRVMPSLKRSGLDIRMVVPGLPIAAPDPLAVSLGGSETAALQLAAEFVRQGHRVTMAANVAEPFTWRGVRLQGGFGEAELARPHDLFLVQRVPQFLRDRVNAKAAFLWLHDLPMLSAVSELLDFSSLADRLLFVSKWQAEQYHGVAPGLAGDRALIVRNGIDLDLVAEATAGVERGPFRIIYTSRPERGLEVLIRGVLPMVLAEEPRATLHLARYDSPSNATDDYYHQLRQLAAPFGDRIVWHPPLNKRDLYRLMACGGLYLHPTPAPVDPTFAETSYITAMEAMACGLPWVSTDRGALPETVGNAGMLVHSGEAGHAGEPEVMARLGEAALRIMRDPVLAESMRAAGLARASMCLEDCGRGDCRGSAHLQDHATRSIQDRR